jgi:hypothetical protein
MNFTAVLSEAGNQPRKSGVASFNTAFYLEKEKRMAKVTVEIDDKLMEELDGMIGFYCYDKEKYLNKKAAAGVNYLLQNTAEKSEVLRGVGGFEIT